MKKIALLCLMFCISLGTFAQATSLTIDNQTPGWLSSKINYDDQQTIESIKVTGYLNGTDIKFLRGLNKSRQLRKIINIEDANIVAGGDIYYDYYNFKSHVAYGTKDSIITGYMFADLNPIQKIILPKSTLSFDDISWLNNTEVDTLVIHGSMEHVSIFGGNWKIRCTYFPEGVKTIDLCYLFSTKEIKNRELYFPSTLERIDGLYCCTDPDVIFHCASTNPEIIQCPEGNKLYHFF